MAASCVEHGSPPGTRCASLPQVQNASEAPADLNCSESRRGAAGRFPPEPLISAPRRLARLACHCHIAAHHPRELARDSEPEPRSPEALSGGGIGLAELPEQLCLLLRGHPDTGVGDGELDDVAAISHFACRKLDLARFGELTRIAQQVQEYLPQPHGVHRQCAEVLLDFNDEAVLVLLGKLSRGADDLIDERCELHGLCIEFELSGLDLRQIEHLVDEAKKVSTSAIDALQRLAFLTIISVRPMIALSGVRSSWLMLDTNCDLFSLANCSWRFLS